MLKHKQACAVFCSEHKRVHASLAGSVAAPLTTDVDEVRACLVRPVDIVDPVSLFVGTSVLKIKMVNQVVKLVLYEVISVDSWEGKCCGSEECECKRFHF